MKGSHLIVIGAGIVGSAVAREAASRGARVTVIEANATPAAGASGAAAGALHPLTGMRLSLREEHLSGFALTRAWLSEGDPTSFSTTGILRLVCKGRQAELWRERVSEMPRELASWCSAESIRDRAPLVTDDVVGGVFIPEGTFVDVPRWVDANLRSSGIEVRTNTRAIAIDETGGGVTVTTERGARFVGDTAVVAAGLDSGTPLVDVALKWRPYKGEMGVFEGIEVPPCPLNHRGYVTPWGVGRVLVGVIDSHPPFDDGVREDLAGRLKERAALIWKGVTENARMVESWSGVRPALADREPKMGLVPGSSRVAVCAGHGGRGLLTGPLSAVAVCELLQSREPDVPASWLLD